MDGMDFLIASACKNVEDFKTFQVYDGGLKLTYPLVKYTWSARVIHYYSKCDFLFSFFKKLWHFVNDKLKCDVQGRNVYGFSLATK